MGIFKNALIIACIGLLCMAQENVGSKDSSNEKLYLVVNLETGDYRYSSTAPDISDDTCRTTELWLRHIPAGKFMMGSQKGELGGWKHYDMTLHPVTLTKDFYIGIFEITQKQWTLLMDSNPSCYPGECRPVERVSYDMIRGSLKEGGAGWPKFGHKVDDNSFLGKINAKTKLTFDLPTDAQWEYACRAVTTTSLNSGKNLLRVTQDPNMSEVGRYYSNRGDGKGGYTEHTKVGSYLPNSWGLYDMHGNVWEWCLDWWGSSTLSKSAAFDPVGQSSGTVRVERGGGWIDYAQHCRSALRRNDTPSTGYHYYGFRVICLPDEK